MPEDGAFWFPWLVVDCSLLSPLLCKPSVKRPPRHPQLHPRLLRLDRVAFVLDLGTPTFGPAGDDCPQDFVSARHYNAASRASAFARSTSALGSSVPIAASSFPAAFAARFSIFSARLSIDPVSSAPAACLIEAAACSA